MDCRVLFFCLFATPLFSATLAPINSKQNNKNLRFISKDGSLTYFKNPSGNLVLSKNYKNVPLLTGSEKDQYYITSSSTRKKIIIEKYEHYYQKLGVRRKAQFFLTNWGEEKTQKLKTGIDPQLHLGDSWISYFSPQENKIFFESLEKKQKKEFKISAPSFFYFTPEHLILKPDHYLYTDINKKGYANLHEFYKGKNSILTKALAPGSRFEICTMDNVIILGEFPRGDTSLKSSISLPRSRSILYESKLPDLGHMICSENKGKVYFIKALAKDPLSPFTQTEVASLDIQTKEIEIISSFKYVTQIFSMDEDVIVSFHEDFYRIKE